MLAESSRINPNVKVQIGNSSTFHRFALERGGGAFAALHAKLEAVATTVPQWAERLDSGVLVTYKDDEGDEVRLTSTADLATALEFGSPLRLAIRPGAPAKPGAKPGPQAGPRVVVRQHPMHHPSNMRKMHHHHHMHRRCHPGAGGGWHRWATGKYGPAPARRLAAAGKLELNAAVQKLAAAMDGDADAAKFVDDTMPSARPPRRMGCGGRGGHPGAQKIFGIRINPAEIHAAMASAKAAFGEKAAAALGVPQEEAWEILEAAKTGDERARAQVGEAMKTA